MRLPIAIIGNGGAAAEAVLAMREHGYAGDIHVFADNRHAPYNPMLGPYLVAGKLPLERAFPFGGDGSFYEANRVTPHLGEPVVRLDAEARELTLASGESHEYQRCLVATGARPAVPPVRGLREALATSEGLPAVERRVFTLQSLDDALALRQALQRILVDISDQGGMSEQKAPSAVPQPSAESTQATEPPRAAVLGASFAGVKIAAVLHELGFEVTLIERETSILPLAAHPDAARIMEEHLLSEGYELRLGAALSGVRLRTQERGGAPASDGRGPAIGLDFGSLPGAADPTDEGGPICDEAAAHAEVELLVVCAGNRPALSFLVPRQVDIGTGILIDEQMRSSIPSLFAAGDVAQGTNLMSGRHEIIGLWSNARYQGRAAGRSMAGHGAGYPGGVPHNITHVGRMLFASVGCVDEYDEVTISQKADSWQFQLRREGRVVGVNLLNCCLSAGVIRQALTRAATGATANLEATWTSFNG